MLPALPDIAAALSPVLAQDKPVVLDEIWLPGALFKGLTAERLADYKGPMYGMFEAEFGVRMIRAEEKLRAVPAGTHEWAKFVTPAELADALAEHGAEGHHITLLVHAPDEYPAGLNVENRYTIVVRRKSTI